MINKDILWVQDSIKEETKLYLDGELLSHSSNRFQPCYSFLCNDKSRKKIRNGSICEVFTQSFGKQKVYFIKGHFCNLDENGRRIPFMASINNVTDLKEAKDKLIELSRRHYYVLNENELNPSEGNSKKQLWSFLLLITVCGLSYLLYTCLSNTPTK